MGSNNTLGRTFLARIDRLRAGFFSRPFSAARLLRSKAEIAAYVEAVLEDGDTRAIPVALRTVAEAGGGMAALANKTKLSRETLYRTLSDRGNPRLDTLTAILAAYGMRLSVRSAAKSRTRSVPRVV